MKKPNIKIFAKEQGYVLPLIFIVTSLVISVIVYVIGVSITTHQVASKENSRANAQLAADAGLDKALIELTNDNDWIGNPSEVELYNNGTIRTTYQITVSDSSVANRKTIQSIGKTYSPASSTTPKSTRKYELDADAVTSGNGPASVVSGVGGLLLNNNSKISGGDVIVNGKITVNNNSQIGLSNNAVNVRVAHQSCPTPANATYPSVCPTGNGQPITINGNGKIYGDVRATNQTTGTNMSNPGLIPNQVYAPVTLPDYDRAAQKAAVATEQTAAVAGCSNGGSRTWPANLKIIGDVTIANNCTVTINGNVWVTGKVEINKKKKIVVSNSVGSTFPVIMTDGQNGFKVGNNGTVTPNNQNTGIQVITYWSNSTCSPDCTNVTGTELANSQNTLTIDLSNNGSAQRSIFYARWSKVRVSNNGALGAVAGQTVELGNNAVISFTTSIPGSSNQIVTWVKRGYIRVF